MKKLILITLALPFLLLGCALSADKHPTAISASSQTIENYSKSRTNQSSPNENVAFATMTNDINRYVFYTPNCKLVDLTADGEIGGFNWYYEIKNGDSVLASAVWHRLEPHISEVDSGVFKLELSYGSNARTVQYFDVRTGFTSEVYSIASEYADYFELDYPANIGFIAYLHFDDSVHYNKAANVYVIVADVFSGDKYRIDREFLSPLTGVNNMVFVNGNELYLDYEVIDGAIREEWFGGIKGDLRNVREIVKFR